MIRAAIKTLFVLCLLYLIMVGLASAIFVYVIGNDFSIIEALQGGGGLLGLFLCGLVFCAMAGLLCQN